jgi:P-type Ca2+ transporter type 2C
VVPLSLAVPGRARLRVAAVRGQPSLAAQLENTISADEGIRDVRANPVTGSVLVLFDPGRLQTPRLITKVRGHIRNLGNRHSGHEAGRPDAGIVWPTLPASEVIARLSTSAQHGLSGEQAESRRATVGANRLPVAEPKSPLAIIAGHLTSMPVLLLGGAAVLSIATGAMIDASVILAVVAANTAVGYVTESRVERILSSLQNATLPEALVRRDGKETMLPASALVPGDLLVLRAGHDVPADARVIDARGLTVDESALTGESAPVVKVVAPLSRSNGALADRVNMVHAGTIVAEGSGLAVVTATGRCTELGRVRALATEASAPRSPLDRELERTGRRLVGVSLAGCAAALGLGLLRGVPAFEMVRNAVALAVAAVPEGLPAVATTTLALGMQRMMRRGTLVRSLAAVESLGATTVICADKTGTLTENRMTVDSWHVGQRDYDQGPDLGRAREMDAALGRALTIAVLCNEAELPENGSDGSGSSTEMALLAAAQEAGIDYRAERLRHPLRLIRHRIEGYYWMATVHAGNGSSELIVLKGAPEHVLARADRWLEGGKEEPLTPEVKGRLMKLNDRIAGRGLRLLGLAFKETATAKDPSYHGLTWVGLVALTDPVRPGVAEAIRTCRASGIRTVVITGDHARTASAIYRELGLRNGDPHVFDASHVDELSSDTLRRLVRGVDVFARVSPADKYRIVRALQETGGVVAMTGDGINDAAALRAADIGVAMGARGTDVARDVADVVLMEDDFGGMVAAVEQGRTIHANIGKSLRFLLATNLSEILVTLAALAVGIPGRLSAIQFLWINLLSDVAPALALAVEPADPDVMARPPRDPAAPMLSPAALAGIAGDAALLAAATLGVQGLAMARYGPGPRATTLAFSTLSSAQLLHALTYRSRAGHRWTSPLLLGAVGGTVSAQLAAMLVSPLRRLLGLTPLTLADWALVAGGAVLPLIVNETLQRRDRDTKPSPSLVKEGAPHAIATENQATARRSVRPAWPRSR